MGKEKKTARRLAVLCLINWDRQKKPIGSFIDAIIHGSGLQPADRHLAVNLVLGVLRQMQYLDAIVSRFSRFPPDKMKPLTLMALRVGVFQIMFLERIPESAAVNETVEALKLENQPSWLLNFVNGVLRNIVRRKKELPGPDDLKTADGFLLNHPQWLVQRWQERYGTGLAAAICRENNKEPLLTVRINSALTRPEEVAELFRRQGVHAGPGRYAPGSLVLESFTGPVANLPGYEEGLFHVQDEAAQLVTLLLGPFAGPGKYLDGCAGLGGKTCQLAQLLSAGGKVFAVEPDSRRVKLLEENRRRLQLETIDIYHGRLDMFSKSVPGLFKGVLIDAPCSGTGVIRRHPDIRWNREQKDLPVFQQQQLELLEQGAALVEPGGILVYATCSMEPEENNQVVESFLHRHGEYAVSDCRPHLPPGAAAMISPAGYFASTPADGMDGFFAARLRRSR
ncbi:MAG: 16S rRNA (cytosine(967)-C(5))-methyltransferase RsmB [Desulfobulbaceae bacterium]|nr:16S rRNA (cytosine(967)-C(5))-methyltransferase RsmB [Desulfobulbaceae bacterium]